MIRNWRLKSALAGLAAIAAAPASAQTPLDVEYEEAQRLLNAAIAEAAGAVGVGAVLPEAAFFNPLRAGTDFSIIPDPADPLEIKGEAAKATERDQRDAAFLTRPNKTFSANDARTQTLAAGALEADNPLHWAFHGDRLYLTPAPKGDNDLREKRSLSISADAAYLSQADAFRHNINFSAARADG